MTATAIRVENLSKQYRLGQPRGRRTFREMLTQSMAAPWRRLARRRSAAAAAHGPSDRTTLWALKDVSFDVRPGQVLGVIGRNGAGKSTLLKILSRITEPTSGYADINGRLGSLLEVGTGFHPELTGRENIFLNGAILGMRRAEIRNKFDDIVSFAEVERFIDTPVKHYSSGMYVRLAFAVAAHLQPEILLVDEVLAVGDVDFQKKCMGKMGKVVREGNTVVLVSHNMGTVRSLCGEAVHLEAGRLVDVGPAEQVVAKYLGANQVHAAERFISREDHKTWTAKMCVQRVRLLNPAATEFSVHWQEPINVEVEIAVAERLEHVRFGAGLKLLDDTWLSCSHHIESEGQGEWAFDPGTHLIRFTLENHVKPGLYFLGLGAHAQHYTKCLFQMETTTIQVLDHTQSGLTPMVCNAGCLNGYATWREPERIG